MALDSMQKRMSAINPNSPWRGPMVDATETDFTQGNRQAAAFFYGGLTDVVVGGTRIYRQTAKRWQRIRFA